MTYKIIDKCRCCNSGNLKEILNLENQPLANDFHLIDVVPKQYPLALNLCLNCFHCQLNVIVDPEILFRNYLYVSGTSNTMKSYFSWLAQLIQELYQTIKSYPPYSILSIAGNDGSELDPFKELGWNTTNVDPAKNLAPISRSKGHRTISEFWNIETARKLNKKYDIILAQNVFAHTDNILEFLEACKLVMNEDSLLFIQTSQANMIKNGEYDTIYHEHLSFFNTSSMLSIVDRAKLLLNNVFTTKAHGTSYVFVISKNPLLINNVQIQLKAEKDIKLYELLTYDNFAIKAIKNTIELATLIKLYQDEGYTVCGYGAAAKAMTVLNFGNIKLDFIVDDNPLKQGLYSPGQNIPIVSKEHLLTDSSSLVILPLAWNFFEEISQKIKELRPNNSDIYIRYFPTLEKIIL